MRELVHAQAQLVQNQAQFQAELIVVRREAREEFEKVWGAIQALSREITELRRDVDELLQGQKTLIGFQRPNPEKT